MDLTGIFEKCKGKDKPYDHNKELLIQYTYMQFCTNILVLGYIVYCGIKTVTKFEDTLGMRTV